jgi:hypothetical protein
MKPVTHVLLALTAVACTTALAQAPAVLRDLDAAGRVTLSKEELGQLLPGASMSRVSAKGNTHFWTNDSDGTFIISSDNRDRGKGSSTARGKWNISDDGRYCVLIEWKTVETEEWCRYIIRVGSDYYGTKSDKTGTEKVYKLEISKK